MAFELIPSYYERTAVWHWLNLGGWSCWGNTSRMLFPCWAGLCLCSSVQQGLQSPSRPWSWCWSSELAPEMSFLEALTLLPFKVVMDITEALPSSTSLTSPPASPFPFKDPSLTGVPPLLSLFSLLICWQTCLLLCLFFNAPGHFLLLGIWQSQGLMQKYETGLVYIWFGAFW